MATRRLKGLSAPELYAARRELQLELLTAKRVASIGSGSVNVSFTNISRIETGIDEINRELVAMGEEINSDVLPTEFVGIHMS